MKGIFFGLNYNLSNEKNNIINIKSIAKFLKEKYKSNNMIFTDDIDTYTSYTGMIIKLYETSISTWKDNIELVVIYFAGDNICYNNGIYKEGILPSDYEDNGVISGDLLQIILKSYNPNTKVIIILDCCYSDKNIMKMKYNWNISDVINGNYVTNVTNVPNVSYVIENINSHIRSDVLVLTYYLKNDNINEDELYNELKILNNCLPSIGDLLIKYKDCDDISTLINNINNELQYNQRENLEINISSSYNIIEKPRIFNNILLQNDNDYVRKMDLLYIEESINEIKKIINIHNPKYNNDLSYDKYKNNGYTETIVSQEQNINQYIHPNQSSQQNINQYIQPNQSSQQNIKQYIPSQYNQPSQYIRQYMPSHNTETITRSLSYNQQQYTPRHFIKAQEPQYSYRQDYIQGYYA